MYTTINQIRYFFKTTIGRIEFIHLLRQNVFDRRVYRRDAVPVSFRLANYFG